MHTDPVDTGAVFWVTQTLEQLYKQTKNNIEISTNFRWKIPSPKEIPACHPKW